MFGFTPDVTLAIWLVVMFVFSMSVDFFFHKGDDIKSATIWSIFWVTCGIITGGFVYLVFGSQGASEYFAGFALEKALSMDNLIVFIAIFSYFGISNLTDQRKVLLWGILGAIVFRGIFVAVGGSLFNAHATLEIGSFSVQVHTIISILFGLIVGYSAYAMLTSDGDSQEEEDDFRDKWYNKLAKKWFPTAGVLVFAGITIELSDVMFSFDSVPTVIAVTKEPMIIYAAMLSAVLGLRAMYFIIRSLVDKLHMLDKFIVAILFFVALKLIIEPFGFDVPPLESVIVVLGLIFAGVFTSLIIEPKNK